MTKPLRGFSYGTGSHFLHRYPLRLTLARQENLLLCVLIEPGRILRHNSMLESQLEGTGPQVCRTIPSAVS